MEYHNKLGNVTISDCSINTLLTWFALPPQSQVSIEQLLMVIYVTQNALYHHDECICGKQKVLSQAVCLASWTALKSSSQ